MYIFFKYYFKIDNSRSKHPQISCFHSLIVVKTTTIKSPTLPYSIDLIKRVVP